MLEYKLKRQRGVSMMTISLLLALMGGTLAAGLILFRQEIAQSHPEVLVTELALVDAALASYAANHHYLPCPAKDPVNQEPDCSSIKGWLPTKELGIEAKLAETKTPFMFYAVDPDLLEKNARYSLATWKWDNSQPTSLVVPTIIRADAPLKKVLKAGLNKEWNNWSDQHVPTEGVSRWPALPDMLPDMDKNGWGDPSEANFIAELGSEDKLDDLKDVDDLKMMLDEQHWKQNTLPVKRGKYDMCAQISEAIMSFSPSPEPYKIDDGTGKKTANNPDADGLFTNPDPNRPYYMFKYKNNNNELAKKQVNIAYAIILPGALDADGVRVADNENAALKLFDGANQDKNSPQVGNPYPYAGGGTVSDPGESEAQSQYDDLVLAREHKELSESVGCPTLFIRAQQAEKEIKFDTTNSGSGWFEIMGDATDWWNERGAGLSADPPDGWKEGGGEQSIKVKYDSKGYANLPVTTLRSISQAVDMVDDVVTEYEAIQVDAINKLWFESWQDQNILIWDSWLWHYQVNSDYVDAQNSKINCLSPIDPDQLPYYAKPAECVSANRFMAAPDLLVPSFALQSVAMGGLTLGIIGHSTVAVKAGADTSKIAKDIEEKCKASQYDPELLAELREEREQPARETKNLYEEKINNSNLDEIQNAVVSCSRSYPNFKQYYDAFMMTNRVGVTGPNGTLSRKTLDVAPDVYKNLYETEQIKNKLQSELSVLEKRKSDQTAEIDSFINQFKQSLHSQQPYLSDAEITRRAEELRTERLNSIRQQQAEAQVQWEIKNRDLNTATTNLDRAQNALNAAESALLNNAACPENDSTCLNQCSVAYNALIPSEGGNSTNYQVFKEKVLIEENYPDVYQAWLEAKNYTPPSMFPNCEEKSSSGAAGPIQIWDRSLAKKILWQANRRGVFQ